MDLPTTAQLVTWIEVFLQRHDMRPTRFGREATGEPQLLDSLRRGRSPSLDTANRIAAYMAQKDAEFCTTDHEGGIALIGAGPSPGNINHHSGVEA